jgi:hypothetical protein
MKVTNGTIFSAREPLRILLGQKFPVMVSYKLAKMAHVVQDQLHIITETRNALIEKHGTKEKGKPGKTVPPNTPAMEAFSKELAELLELEVELKIEKVKLPEKVAATCDKCHHNMDRPLEIEPSILLALEDFIEV